MADIKHSGSAADPDGADAPQVLPSGETGSSQHWQALLTQVGSEIALLSLIQ